MRLHEANLGEIGKFADAISMFDEPLVEMGAPTRTSHAARSHPAPPMLEDGIDRAQLSGLLVGTGRFELPTPCSQSSTWLLRARTAV